MYDYVDLTNMAAAARRSRQGPAPEGDAGSDGGQKAQQVAAADDGLNELLEALARVPGAHVLGG